jgi:predicted permease
VDVVPYVDRIIGAEAKALLGAMFAAVVFVLLIACANVANLLIGRAMARGREVAIRTAMGATKRRIAAQFVTEALVLAVGGLILGSAIAWLGIRMFTASMPPDPPFWIRIELDGAALLFASVASVFATLVAGSVPAVQAARANTHEALKDEARGSSSFRLGRMSRALVVAEIALSVALLAGTGLMVKSIMTLRGTDLGFPAAEVFAARIGLPTTGYGEAEEQRQFVNELLPRLSGLPRVNAATVGTALPGTGSPQTSYTLEGVVYQADIDVPTAASISVAPGYFGAFGQTVLRGRDFGGQDVPDGMPVAIVNESFEQRHFADGTAIGQRFRPGGRESQQQWVAIVGVVRDLFTSGIRNENPEAIYVPFAQTPARFFNAVIRSSPDPMAVTPHVRGAVTALDADLALYWVDRLDRMIEQQNWITTVFGTLFAVLGVIALFLAAVGLYGVMSFSVGQRTREMGVRMALGASPGSVLALVLKQGVWQLGIGLGIGLILAMFGTPLLQIILLQVEPRDPATYGIILTVLVAAALLACYIPARRATRVSPLESLRFD